MAAELISSVKQTASGDLVLIYVLLRGLFSLFSHLHLLMLWVRSQKVPVPTKGTGIEPWCQRIDGEEEHICSHFKYKH